MIGRKKIAVIIVAVFIAFIAFVMANSRRFHGTGFNRDGHFFVLQYNDGSFSGREYKFTFPRDKMIKDCNVVKEGIGIISDVELDFHAYHSAIIKPKNMGTEIILERTYCSRLLSYEEYVDFCDEISDLNEIGFEYFEKYDDEDGTYYVEAISVSGVIHDVVLTGITKEESGEIKFETTYQVEPDQTGGRLDTIFLVTKVNN